jgi:tetratricopeptide (TPR) repeat protein
MNRDPSVPLPAGTADATAAARAMLIDRRLEGITPHARHFLHEAGRAIQARRADRADAALVQARALLGEHVEVLRMLGITRHLQQRHTEALALLRRALEIQPGDPLILMNLGVVLRAAGERQASEAALRKACERVPDLAAPWYNLGTTLAADLRPAEAERAHAQALERDPNHVDARLGRADALRSLGHIDEAAAECRRVIATSPRTWRAWSKLANLKTIRFTADETERLREFFADASLPDEDRVSLGFALTKALEDGDRYAEAELALIDANAIQRRLLRWDAVGFQRTADATAAAFASPPLTAAPADLGREVIFVICMPRSGSTLTVQILASHPEVHGAGELADLGRVIDDESRRRGVPFPGWVTEATPDDWRRLGEDYLERTRRWRGGRARFTDKSLANWLYVGAAMAMLPGAHIINVRRDPVENCLSVYRQLFGRGHGYSYDLDELGAFRRAYDRLTGLWRTQHPERIHDFVYEDLVDDPDTVIRELLAFCDLAFDPACLNFHETRREVRTPSSGQVRQPLRRDTARAARYPAIAAALRRTIGIAPAAPE